jgi:hypothetical protein
VNEELDLYLPWISLNGCLGLHDSITWAGVPKALFKIRNDYDVTTFATSRGSGLSLTMKKVTLDSLS